MISTEAIGTLAALSGFVGTTIIALWRIFKGVKTFTDEQEKIKDCLKTIKKEVTPNSGSSMKDAVTQLTITVDRIEIRQKIFDQRTKASLHYMNQALFEIDSSGRLTWFNQAFEDLTNNNSIKGGHDWYSLVDEEERQRFIEEITSCLRMSRKIDIEAKSVNDNLIQFVGYPYKIEGNSHEGFLIHIYIKGE